MRERFNAYGPSDSSPLNCHAVCIIIPQRVQTVTALVGWTNELRILRFIFGVASRRSPSKCNSWIQSAAFATKYSRTGPDRHESRSHPDRSPARLP
jgi:hypothetical protein